MNVGLDTAAHAPLAAAAGAPPGWRGILVDIVIRPAAALRHLAERPGWRWVGPLVVLALLSAVLAGFQARSAMAGALASVGEGDVATSPSGSVGAMTGTDARPEAVMQTASTVGTILGAVGGIIGVVIGVALAAAILHFLGTVFGGQQSFAQMFTVTSWAQVPLIFGALVKLAYGLAAGFDPNPGLSGLVDKTSLMFPVLAQIELWHLWSLALLVIGMRVVSRLTRGKALATVGALIALQVLVGELGVLAAQFFGGL